MLVRLRAGVIISERPFFGTKAVARRSIGLLPVQVPCTPYGGDRIGGNASSVEVARLINESGAAPPKPAVTSCDELQAVFVTWPVGVFRQLEILLGRLPAFAVLRALLHLGRGVLHQREDILRILLGAEPAVRLSGMAGDQPVPVQCEHLLDELLGLEGIDR